MIDLSPHNFYEFLPESIVHDFYNSKLRRNTTNLANGFVSASFEEGLTLDISNFNRSYKNKYFSGEYFFKNSRRLADRAAKITAETAARHRIRELFINITIICDNRRETFSIKIVPVDNNPATRA